MSTLESPPLIRSKPKKLLRVRKHPPYLEMVSDALVTLKECNGSSQYVIGKFLEEKHKDLPVNFKKLLLIQLKKLVASNKLVKVKASYKLPSNAKMVAAAKPKKGAAPAKKESTAHAKSKAVPAKAKPTPKANLGAKAKPPPKAKSVAKAKPVPKAKPTSKAKLAPKAKPPAKAKPAAKIARTPTRWMPGKKTQSKVDPKTSGGLIPLEEIIKYFGKPMEEAAGILLASRATLKRLCKSFGISRWPYETDKSDTLNSIFKGSNEPYFTTNMTHRPATFSKHGTTPILHQQVQTNLPDELVQPVTTSRNSVTLLTIKATYNEDMADNYENYYRTRNQTGSLDIPRLLLGHLQPVGLDFPIYLSEVAVKEEALCTRKRDQLSWNHCKFFD